MLEALKHRSTMLGLRGACAMLFGLLTLVWPGATVLTLVVVFGAYVLAEGLITGVMAFSPQPPQSRWLLGFEALLGLVVGVVAVTRPGFTAATMVTYLGIWAVIVGGLRIVQAVMLRKEPGSAGLLVASGALTIGLGLVAISRPGAGALAVAWVIGVLAIAFGIAEVSLAFRLRQVSRQGTTAAPRTWSMRAEEQPEAVRDRMER